MLGDVEGRDLERALYLARLVLPDAILLCNDKMSMAAGLELRVPFLDRELMGFVERIPGRMRVRKALHRDALRRLLPEEIVTRPKHGFATPYDRWLRESLGAEVERRYASDPSSARWWRRTPHASSWPSTAAGEPTHKSILYCLLELSEWHRAFVQAAAPVPA